MVHLEYRLVMLCLNTHINYLISRYGISSNFTRGSNYSIAAKSEAKIPFEWEISTLPPETKNEVVFAFLILIFVYVLIIFEVRQRKKRVLKSLKNILLNCMLLVLLFFFFQNITFLAKLRTFPVHFQKYKNLQILDLKILEDF